MLPTYPWSGGSPAYCIGSPHRLEAILTRVLRAAAARLWLSVGVAVLVAFAAAQAAELPDTIKQAGALRLTVNSTYAPMEYRDPATDQLVGLDLANEIAKRMGVKII